MTAFIFPDSLQGISLSFSPSPVVCSFPRCVFPIIFKLRFHKHLFIIYSCIFHSILSLFPSSDPQKIITMRSVRFICSFVHSFVVYSNCDSVFVVVVLLLILLFLFSAVQLATSQINALIYSNFFLFIVIYENLILQKMQINY